MIHMEVVTDNRFLSLLLILLTSALVTNFDTGFINFFVERGCAIKIVLVSQIDEHK